ncbi:hypothetical protein ACWCPS_36005 [Streptomyces mauvecolor]
MTTADDIVKRYADDIAYVAEKTPAIDLDTFIDQLETATLRLSTAHFNGHEDLETAGQYLADARDTEAAIDREVLFRKADELLHSCVESLTQEWRDAVED